MEELLFYCTEELGSESTAGVGRNLYTYDREHTCASSLCTMVSKGRNLEVGESPSTSRNMSTHASAPQQDHRCHTSSRAFPPPIASLLTDRPLMRSFKSNGRFILKKVTNVSRSLFRSTREDGHLRLDLLSGSFDCLESQDGLLFPASSSTPSPFEDVAVPAKISSSSDFHHNRDCDHDPDMRSTPVSYQSLRSPTPCSIVQRTPPLQYETLCTPSKFQAFALLINQECAASPPLKESISIRSTSFQAEHIIKGQRGGSTAIEQSTPYVFAVFKLLPVGLGLIIFKIGKWKGKDCITLYGVHIPKSYGYECGRASMSPSHHHLLTNLCGISSEVPKGKLFPFKDCNRESYMEEVFS